MPAHTIHDTRAKRPLTCDVCSQSIAEGSIVSVCKRCNRVRHTACPASPCGKCASVVHRQARFGGAKLMRYL
jgi:hypothetical protein